MRTAVAAALALLLTVPACGGMTRNHKQGLGVVGGLGVVVGSMVLVDGMSCEESNWHNGTCDHDSGELRNGGITLGAGAALLGFALYQLSQPDAEDGPAPAAAPSRTATRK